MSDLERPGIARRTAGAFGAGLVRAARSGLRAELGDRDATFIRRTGPPLRTLTRAWFRPTIRGLEHVPDAGPALLVGNHSGGNLSPDTLILALALARRQGPEREFFQLSENLLLASPWGHVARRLGAVPVNWATASSALARGA
nr:1-acyl-sn-glycerol-3-phosphate acyltransferase [Solirubrobacterales bacterium]